MRLDETPPEWAGPVGEIGEFLLSDPLSHFLPPHATICRPNEFLSHSDSNKDQTLTRFLHNCHRPQRTDGISSGDGASNPEFDRGSRSCRAAFGLCRTPALDCDR